MNNIFFASDHHLFHSNILKFTRADGTRLRPFDHISEMHELIVANHNRLVRPQDKVYFMGDVSLRYDLPFQMLIRRFNGRKRFLLGNHDRIKGTPLLNFFDKAGVWRVFGAEGFVVSHIPMHRSCFPHKTVLNVHGHIHYRVIPDPDYFNVSMENVSYTPVPLDVILDKVKRLRDEAPQVALVPSESKNEL